MSNEAMAQMPQYRCHKKVGALKIARVEQQHKSYFLHVVDASRTSEDGLRDMLAGKMVDNVLAPISVSEEWISKHKPEAGGYFVVYEDGYQSYSPAKAFKEGYTRIAGSPPVTQLRYGALSNEQLVDEILKEGADDFVIDAVCDRLDPMWRQRRGRRAT